MDDELRHEHVAQRLANIGREVSSSRSAAISALALLRWNAANEARSWALPLGAKVSASRRLPRPSACVRARSRDRVRVSPPSVSNDREMEGAMSGVSRRLAALAAAAIAVAATVVPGASANGSKPPGLQFLGQAIVPTGTTFAGTTIGGLSSITYDAGRGVFYSLSDDQSQFNPARFYTLHIDLSNGKLADGDVHFDGVTTLLAPDGLPYAPFSLDPE